MPGDELHDNAAAGARSGPRHAAPRKPLLTRLHVPAGKAIAIAAMPSAVLMGIGITPQLAVAKPAPENPFKDGPCVTAPDKQEQEQAKEEKAAKEAKAAKDKAAKEKAAKEKAAKEKAEESSASPSAGKDADETPAPESSASGTDEPSGSATPSPSASDEKKDDGGVLGGIGDALGGLFGGDKESDEPSASASPSPSESKDATPKATESEDGASKDSKSATGKLTDPVKDTVDGLKDGADKAGKTANDTVHGAVGMADNALPGGGLDGKDASGKKAYPCVVENKQKGKDEQTPTTLPDLPWHLETSGLTLRGLDYAGVVNVGTQNGQSKQVLKFTADSVDIENLHQIVDDPASGKKYHVRSKPGSTSTITGGKVTMYTERLQGNLFGLIPIVFDPEHPPPINVPFAYFNKVKLDQAGQFGGNLHVPGMHVTIED